MVDHFGPPVNSLRNVAVHFFASAVAPAGHLIGQVIQYSFENLESSR